jgi:hypothetical protein
MCSLSAVILKLYAWREELSFMTTISTILRLSGDGTLTDLTQLKLLTAVVMAKITAISH